MNVTASRLPVALLALFLVLGASPGAAAPAEVVIELTGESVGVTEVAPGGRVTLRAVTGDHDIVADDGSWGTGVIPEGQEAVLQFNQVGDYAYSCTIHANETGIVRVVDDEVEAPEDSPPAILIESPEDGETVDDRVDVRLVVTDADDLPEDLDVQVRVDDGPLTAVPHASGNAWEWTWDTRGLASGSHTLEAVVTDSAGATARASVRVHVGGASDEGDDDDVPRGDEDDGNTRPLVAFRAPAPGTAVRGSVDVTGTATDADDDTLRVEVAVDDGAWSDADGGEEWRFTWDITGYAPGEHSIRARAWDGTAYSSVVTLDLVIPEPVNGFDGPPGPGPSAPGVEAVGWKNVVLDAGWAVLALIALSSAWAWASSRP